MTCVYPHMQTLRKLATGFSLTAVAVGLLIASAAIKDWVMQLGFLDSGSKVSASLFEKY
jgi:hypothetical protein